MAHHGDDRVTGHPRVLRCHVSLGRIAAGLGVFGLMVALPQTARAEDEVDEPETAAVEREGLHFRVAFGWGGGPTSHGLVHDMELGGTIDDGLTLCYQHAFIWSRGLAKPDGGSDLWGGHFLMLKVPLADYVVYKAAVGLGENVDMSDGFRPRFGFGMTMGLDVDFPIWPTSGITLGVLVMHVATVDVGQQIGAGATVGYAWF